MYTLHIAAFYLRKVKRWNNLFCRLCGSVFYFLVGTICLYGQSELRDSLDHTVVITASKTAQSPQKNNKPTIVVTSEDIRRSGATDLAQVLHQQTGIIVNGANSAHGQNKSVYVQGGNADEILILVDGVPINDPSGIGGAYDLRFLAMDNIDRIEVVKGSQSTLYGTDAAAGVINIITKTGNDQDFNLNAGLVGGSYNFLEAKLGVSGGNKTLRYGVDISRQSSDGISAARDTTEGAGFDDDGHEHKNLSAYLLWQPNEAFTMRPYARVGDYETDIDDSGFVDSDSSRFEALTYQLGNKLAYQAEKLEVHLDYAYNRTKRDFLQLQFGDFPFLGAHHHVDLYGSSDWGAGHQLLLGLNYQNFQQTNFASSGDQNSSYTQDIWSAYGQYSYDWSNKFNFQVAGRINQHSSYGTHLNYETSIGYWIVPQAKLEASYSTGFRNPLLSQLFGFGGNAELLPEESRFFYAGIRGLLFEEKLNYRISYFSRQLENRIGYNFNTSSFVNEGSIGDNGIEFQAEYSGVDRWWWLLDYTYLHDPDPMTDAYRPTHRLGINQRYTISEFWEVGLRGDYFGARTGIAFTDIGTEQVDLGAYWLWQVQGRYQANEAMDITLTLRNVFDAEFYEIYGFGTQGRNFLLGVQVRL